MYVFVSVIPTTVIIIIAIIIGAIVIISVTIIIIIKATKGRAGEREYMELTHVGTSTPTFFSKCHSDLIHFQ